LLRQRALLLSAFKLLGTVRLRVGARPAVLLLRIRVVLFSLSRNPTRTAKAMRIALVVVKRLLIIELGVLTERMQA
jgi:hypothetical protein